MYDDIKLNMYLYILNHISVFFTSFQTFLCKTIFTSNMGNALPFSSVISTSNLGVRESGNPLSQSNNHSDCTLTKC